MSQKQVVTRPGGTLKINQINGTIGAAGGVNVLTVPTGKAVRLQGAVVDVVASATVGNRVLVAKLTSGGVLDWIGAASGNVTAGQTGGYDICFGSCGTPSTTVRRNLADSGNTNVQVREYCPMSWLRAGQILTIDDLGDVDNADVAKYRVYYTEYEA